MRIIKHLLGENGIISKFTISKQITKKEMDKIKKSIKLSPTSKKYNDSLNQKLLNYTMDYVKKYNIPGIISEQTENPSEKALPDFPEEDGKLELDKLANTFIYAVTNINKISDKDKLCYLIVYLIINLKLSQGDFEEFYKNYGKNSED